jgi:hypothetical protein
LKAFFSKTVIILLVLQGNTAAAKDYGKAEFIFLFFDFIEAAVSRIPTKLFTPSSSNNFTAGML